MAVPRVIDTGVEAAPVELTDGTGAVIAIVTAGAQDAFGQFARGFPGYTLAYTGAAWDRLRTPAVFRTVNLTAATAETTIWTPAGGKKFRLMGFVLTAGGACDLEFRDNTAGTSILFVAMGTAPLVLSLGNGILSAAANNVLTVTRSVSTTLKGTLLGLEE